MATKTPPETRAEIKKLWKQGGWSLNALARKFGITRTTIHMIVDPFYAEYRRNSINCNRRANPPPSEQARRSVRASLRRVRP